MQQPAGIFAGVIGVAALAAAVTAGDTRDVAGAARRMPQTAVSYSAMPSAFSPAALVRNVPSRLLCLLPIGGFRLSLIAAPTNRPR